MLMVKRIGVEQREGGEERGGEGGGGGGDVVEGKSWRKIGG